MIVTLLPLSLVLAAILWALHGELLWDVRRYFLAQLAYTIVILIATLTLGTKSPIYAVLYVVFTLVIIVTMFGILQGKIRGFLAVLTSWAMGAFLGLRCFMALQEPIRYYQWITLAEGMTLAACGTFLIWHSPKEKSRGIYFWMATLWLALAAYRLCYTIEIGNPYWTNLNRFFPALMCFVVFSIIAWSARRIATIPNRKSG